MTKLFMNVFKKVKLNPEEYKLYDAKAHFTVLYIIPNMIWVKIQTSVTQHKLTYYILQLFNKKCKKLSLGRKSWIQEYRYHRKQEWLDNGNNNIMESGPELDVTLKGYKKCCRLHLVLSAWKYLKTCETYFLWNNSSFFKISTKSQF